MTEINEFLWFLFVCFYWVFYGLLTVQKYDARFHRKTEKKFIAVILWPYLVYELVRHNRW